MRAVVHDRYGPPEVLRVEDVTRPVPKDDEVLVAVHASTVTRGDAMRVRSDRYRFARLITGVRRPGGRHCGTEFAGRVEAVGSAVADLREGDDVFGVEAGANAEYVKVRESEVIVPKPGRVTYEEAAAIPDGSLLALYVLAAGGRSRASASSSTGRQGRSERPPSSCSRTTSQPT